VRGRESPSMLAFTYRAQPGTTARALSLQVARYTPQAVLIASIEEAPYDVLLDEEGKALVRARYAVRNNQRAFLAVRLRLATSTVRGPCRPRRRCVERLLLEGETRHPSKPFASPEPPARDPRTATSDCGRGRPPLL
jgi:hypothetical protein